VEAQRVYVPCIDCGEPFSKTAANKHGRCLFCASAARGRATRKWHVGDDYKGRTIVELGPKVMIVTCEKGHRAEVQISKQGTHVACAQCKQEAPLQSGKLRAIEESGATLLEISERRALLRCRCGKEFARTVRGKKFDVGASGVVCRQCSRLTVREASKALFSSFVPQKSRLPAA